MRGVALALGRGGGPSGDFAQPGCGTWVLQRSPDESRIVFTSNRTGNDDIRVMNADGTGAVDLTPVKGLDRTPDWQPVP